MNSWTKFLAALLLVQVGLAAAFITQSNQLSSFSSDEPLLGDLSSVNQISVFEKDQPALNLEKKEGHWVLSDKKDLALSAEKLVPLTETIMQSKKSYPVGKTALAAKQFKVADSEFERKIVFSKDAAPLKTLYIGSSPTFKKVHARVDGEDNTYVISANAYELSTKYTDWLNKDILQVDQKKIAKITFGKLSLVEKDSRFVLEGLAEDQETNQSEVSTLVSKLTSLRFEDILSDEQVAAIKDKAVFDYSIQTKENESYNYKLLGPIEDDFFAVKTEKYPYYFKVRKAGLDTLKDITKEKLAQAKKAPEAAPVTEPVAAENAASATDAH